MILYQVAPRPDKVDCKIHELALPKMDLDTQEIRETHNLYIKSICGSLKNIVFDLLFIFLIYPFQPILYLIKDAIILIFISFVTQYWIVRIMLRL